MDTFNNQSDFSADAQKIFDDLMTDASPITEPVTIIDADGVLATLSVHEARELRRRAFADHAIEAVLTREIRARLKPDQAMARGSLFIDGQFVDVPPVSFRNTVV